MIIESKQNSRSRNRHICRNIGLSKPNLKNVWLERKLYKCQLPHSSVCPKLKLGSLH